MAYKNKNIINLIHFKTKCKLQDKVYMDKIRRHTNRVHMGYFSESKICTLKTSLAYTINSTGSLLN